MCHTISYLYDTKKVSLAGDLQAFASQGVADHGNLPPGYCPELPGDDAAFGGECHGLFERADHWPKKPTHAAYSPTHQKRKGSRF